MVAVSLCGVAHSSLGVWLACGIALGAVLGAYAWAKSGKRAGILIALVFALCVAGAAKLHADDIIVPDQCQLCSAGEVPCFICWLNLCSCGGMNATAALWFGAFVLTGGRL